MLIDTSAIVELLRCEPGSEAFNAIFKKIEKELLFISEIQLAEIAAWAISEEKNTHEIVDQVKSIANIIPLTEEICLSAAEIRNEQRKAGKKKFGIIDGIILATARSTKQQVLTKDADFEGCEDAVLI
jgi:predicted nucleic acid-binding protein